MDKLMQVKINSSLCLALVEEDKFLESSNFFNAYINDIQRLRIDRKLKEEELSRAREQYIDVLLKKAKKHFQNSEWAKAIICFNISYNYNPQIFENVNILETFITCLAQSGQQDLAINMINELNMITANKYEECKFIANIYDLLKDNENSIKYMEEYINHKKPDEISAEEYNLLGIYYNRLYFDDMKKNNYLYKAIDNFKKAHNKNPLNKTYLHNITIVAQYINEYELINTCWKKIWEIGGLTHTEKFDYALQSIKQGRIKEGYAYYHEEFYLEDTDRRITFRDLKKPVWQGEDIKNKTLLIHHHQGFGDTILMSKFINMVKEHTSNIIYVVQNELYSLIKNSFQDITVLADNMAHKDTMEYDYYIPTMELPVALKIDRKEIEVTNNKYLFVNPEKINYYKQNYFNNNNFKIGISIKGNQEYDKYLKRAIPLTDFKVFDNLKNTTIYILTRGVPDTDLNIFNNNPVINIAKTFDSFEDTAAAIENCDLVISIDNSTMNLAGALGKKTFGLFNYYNEWRWFDLSGDNIVWYSSVKPYVNEKMNDWKPTIEKVVEELQNYITTVL